MLGTLLGYYKEILHTVSVIYIPNTYSEAAGTS